MLRISSSFKSFAFLGLLTITLLGSACGPLEKGDSGKLAQTAEDACSKIVTRCASKSADEAKSQCSQVTKHNGTVQLALTTIASICGQEITDLLIKKAECIKESTSCDASELANTCGKDLKETLETSVKKHPGCEQLVEAIEKQLLSQTQEQQIAGPPVGEHSAGK